MEQVWVGVDVCKKFLDVAIGRGGESFRVRNDADGHKQLIDRVESGAGIVMEATGGYERHVHRSLCAAGMTTCIVNPRQVRDFAKAMGRLAKTDRIDAKMLVWFGEVADLDPTPVPRPLMQRIRALSHRREQVVGMIRQEKCALSTGRSGASICRRTPGGAQGAAITA